MYFVFLFKTKSNSFKASKNFIADVASYGKINFICNDGEFIPSKFHDLVIKNKIKHIYTCPYSMLCPDQEQINRKEYSISTLVEVKSK